MNSEEFIKKVNDRTLTLGEAFKHTLTRPDANVKNIQGLINHYKNVETPINLDAKFFDIYETREFVETVGYPTNRFGAFGAFESVFKKSLNPTNFKASEYKRISGPGNTADGFGLGGSQNRGKDPMRGTIYSKDLDKIYQDVLSKGTYVDSKTGKTVTISDDTRDFLIYEKYTGQRVDTNIGVQGLKLSELIPGVDPQTGQVFIDVQSKITKTKTRPAVRYTDEFAEFLIDKLNRAKAVAGPNANYTTIDLFQTNKTKVDAVWNNAIRPELELKFEAQLPLGDGGRGKAPPKVIRKILARQLVHEFQYPVDIVKSWMGHAGAGVSASGDILTDNYVGVVPDERIGLVSNNLIRNDGFNVKSGTANALFTSRGSVVEGFSIESNKAYESFTKSYSFSEASVDSSNVNKPVGLRLSDKKRIDAENNKIIKKRELETVKIDIEKQDKEIYLTEKKKINLAAKQNLTLDEYKALEIEKQNKLALKKEALSEKMPKSPSEFSDGLKQALESMGVKISEVATSKTGKAAITAAATLGTTVAKSSPLVAGGLEYQMSKGEGKGEFESGTRAIAEAVNPLPVGIREFEQVGEAVAKKAADDSSISDSGSFLDALTGSLTGQSLNLSGGYASGGFVNRQNRR